MSSFSTPKESRKRTDGSQSPSLKNDGISPKKNHLPRSEVVQQIYDTAKMRQHVVIGSSAGTGKTSLLQLLELKLKQEGANIVLIKLDTDRTNEDLFEELKTEGEIVNKPISKLRQIKNTWLLLDDAQHIYDRKFDPFWRFVVKGISSADVDDNLFVVIAATYDLSTPESPADFRGLDHINPNVTEEEAIELFQMHAEVWGYEKWNIFRENLIELSKFTKSPQSYHIGVVMAGVRMLDELRKQPSQGGLSEDRALEALRKEKFTGFLDRCYRLPDDLPVRFKDCLLDAVLGYGQDDYLENDASLAPFIRQGLLTRTGQFSNIAARWYYNRRCFPNRATKAPETLNQLITLAVSSISAKRLRDTLDNGFPKEATFQHLFNEAMSQNLPLRHVIIPELNTKVENPPNGPDVTGELDFYVNGKLKWCVELLIGGKQIGEHIRRFSRKDSKYRKVDMSDYIVVDCRGPITGKGAQLSKFRCTLYFAEDFKTCWCQMRTEKTMIKIKLAN